MFIYNIFFQCYNDLLFSYSYDGNVKVWSIRELVGLKPEERPESDDSDDSQASTPAGTPQKTKDFNEKPNGAAMSAFTTGGGETEAIRPRDAKLKKAQAKMVKEQPVTDEVQDVENINNSSNVNSNNNNNNNNNNSYPSLGDLSDIIIPSDEDDDLFNNSPPDWEEEIMRNEEEIMRNVATEIEIIDR